MKKQQVYKLEGIAAKWLILAILGIVPMVFSKNLALASFSAGMSHSSRIEKQFKNTGYEIQSLYGGFIAYMPISLERWSFVSDLLYWSKANESGAIAIQVQGYEVRPWARYSVYRLSSLAFYGALGLGFHTQKVESHLYQNSVSHQSSIESDLGLSAGLGVVKFSFLHLDLETQYFLPTNDNRKSYFHLTLRAGLVF